MYMKPGLRGKRHSLWVNGLVPREFVYIGTIEPNEDDLSIPCNSYGYWDRMPAVCLMQWQWDNDRETLLAAAEAEERRQLALKDEAKKKRAEYLSNVTLDELANQRFFPNWAQHFPANAVRLSRKTMKTAVRDLIALAPSADEDGRMDVLRECIQGFAQLEADLAFVATEGRVDIADEFQAIVCACGMGERKEECLAELWAIW